MPVITRKGEVVVLNRCEFYTQAFGVYCVVRVFRRGGMTRMKACRMPTKQNKNTKWHEIDIGEMLARTNLELVR